MKVTKLDRRHKGHTCFKYYVIPDYQPNTTLINTLFEWREWAWQTWGTGVERDHIYSRLGDIPWAWHIDSPNHVYRIYLRDEKELAWFTLRWS